jgi:hypothetical protein
MGSNRRASRVVALASALLLSGAATGFAQEPSEFEATHIAGWSFTPGVLASTVYDNNVGLLAEFPTRPETAGDQLFVVQPFGQFEYHGPRTTFESGYRGNLRRYIDLNELNGFDQRVFASLRHRATRRTTLFMSEMFKKVPSTDELELEGVVFTRAGSHSNTLAGGVESRLTRYWDLTVNYDFNWIDFERTNILLRGGVIHSARAALARRLNDRAALGVEYGVRLADLDDGARKFLFQDVGGTFRYELGPQTSIHAGAGVSQLLDRLLNERRRGPYVRGEITHHLERAVIGGGYTRIWVPTFGFGGASKSEAANAYVAMPISRNRVYVQQSISWRRTNPLIETTFPLDSWWVHSTVGYAMSRWMRVQGYYAYTRQDSKIPGGLINRHRVGAQVVLSQPVRIR